MKEEFTITSNRASSIVVIELKKISESTQQLLIYDVKGNVVKRVYVSENTKFIDVNVSELSSGYYIVSVSSQNSVESKPLIIVE